MQPAALYSRQISVGEAGKQGAADIGANIQHVLAAAQRCRQARHDRCGQRLRLIGAGVAGAGAKCKVDLIAADAFQSRLHRQLPQALTDCAEDLVAHLKSARAID